MIDVGAFALLPSGVWAEVISIENGDEYTLKYLYKDEEVMLRGRYLQLTNELSPNTQPRDRLAFYADYLLELAEMGSKHTNSWRHVSQELRSALIKYSDEFDEKESEKIIQSEKRA